MDDLVWEKMVLVKFIYSVQFKMFKLNNIHAIIFKCV